MPDKEPIENVQEPTEGSDATIETCTAAGVAEQRRAAAIRQVRAAGEGDEEQRARTVAPQNRSAKRVVSTDKTPEAE